MKLELYSQLNPLWSQAFACNNCNLLDGYSPQFRPPGVNYKPGGIVFVQINPGHIGTLTKEEIVSRYKCERNREKARLKAEVSKCLLSCQIEFQETGDAESWDTMCEEYRHAMRDVWGWPLGKYRKTIESHGVDLDDIAVINLAQCPVPNDKYKKWMLETCWDTWTKNLLEILKPRLIVAQGALVYRFLIDKLPASARLVKGVHHASRMSWADREEAFAKARNLVARQLTKV